MGLLRRTCALLLMTLCVVASARAQVSTRGADKAFDLAGTSFFTIAPCRVFDTRADAAPLLSGVTRIFAVAGHCGIPSVAEAVAVNLTIVSQTAAGFVSAFPGDDPLPVTSTINFVAGKSLANNAIVPLAENGEGSLALFAFVQGAGQVDAILDVNGYFASEELAIRSLTPSSVLQGSAPLTLTVTGTGFQNSAFVRFDGFDLATTPAAVDRLTATLPAARLEAAGTFPVQVVNPDGSASAAALFTVEALWP